MYHKNADDWGMVQIEHDVFTNIVKICSHHGWTRGFSASAEILPEFRQSELFLTNSLINHLLLGIDRGKTQTKNKYE